MARDKPSLPPRLRDWTEGTPQIGAFLRTREGGTVELVNNAATAEQEALVLALVLGASKVPAETMRDLRRWVDLQLKRTRT